jgi:metal-sulfur cluster biosynthetic enzyme
MTLTAPGCGMGPVLVEDVKTRISAVPFVTNVEVDLVFDPPWSRDMMSEAAQLELGLF